MEITVGDLSSYITEWKANPAALAAVRDVCRARPKGYNFMRRYKAGVWDGYISLMQSTTRFPTGLLPIVAKRLQDMGYKLTFNMTMEFIDADPVTPDMLRGITLRDYQIEAINTLLLKTRGIARMATNSGKTEVMAGIIKALHMPQTIVIVSSKELLYQTSKRLQYRLGTKVGKIGDSIWDRKQITVAMIQTLHARLMNELVNSLVLIDECHHGSSDTMMDVLGKVHGAYRYGFSGTPLTYDLLSDMKLMASTGRVIVEVTNKYLIANEYSALPKIHLHVIENTDEEVWKWKYQQAYSELIVHNKDRNVVIADAARTATGIVLILVNTLEHGRLLQSMIKDSIFVHGSDEAAVRLEILEKMRQDAYGVFIATPIFDEGVDVPSIDTVILAGGGKSHIKLLQRIGRGMRKKEKSNVLYIHDFIDDTNKFLLRHSDARISVYVEEGFETILN